uniref:Uncharacterized protein n=1 Tax=Anguilla anguilla TaxID=7936 RepID=A0A0E9TQW2_ANGAN
MKAVQEHLPMCSGLTRYDFVNNTGLLARGAS